MAESVPELDDGELWLPAEIMADVGLRRFHHASAAAAASAVAASRGRHRHASEVERLANQLAALGPFDLVHLHPALKLRPPLPRHLEGFKSAGPACRLEPKDGELWMGLHRHGREAAAPDVCGRRFDVGSRLEVVRPWPVDLVQLQVEEAFGRVPQRLRPTQDSFGAVRHGGPRRDRGGTGVFHPRVVTKHEVKKRYAVEQKQQQQQPTRSTVMWQQGNPFQLSSEMMSLLPQDWTY